MGREGTFVGEGHGRGFCDAFPEPAGLGHRGLRDLGVSGGWDPHQALGSLPCETETSGGRPWLLCTAALLPGPPGWTWRRERVLGLAAQALLKIAQ